MRRLQASWSPTLTATAAWLFLFPAFLGAQIIISARPGLLHYTEGSVRLSDPRGSQGRAGKIIHVEEGQRLVTKEGRAELLLLPGVFLRQAEHSEIVMVSGDSSDLRARLLTGSIVVDVSDGSNNEAVSILCGQSVIRFPKRGLYRIDNRVGEIAVLRVFRGKALVSAVGGEFDVKANTEILLAQSSPRVVIRGLNRSKKDDFHRWNRRRHRIMQRQKVAQRKAEDQGQSLGSVEFGQ